MHTDLNRHFYNLTASSHETSQSDRHNGLPVETPSDETGNNVFPFAAVVSGKTAAHPPDVVAECEPARELQFIFLDGLLSGKFDFLSLENPT